MQLGLELSRNYFAFMQQVGSELNTEISILELAELFSNPFVRLKMVTKQSLAFVLDEPVILCTVMLLSLKDGTI